MSSTVSVPPGWSHVSLAHPQPKNLAREVRFDDGTRPFKVQPAPKPAKPVSSDVLALAVN